MTTLDVVLILSICSLGTSIFGDYIQVKRGQLFHPIRPQSYALHPGLTASHRDAHSTNPVTKSGIIWSHSVFGQGLGRSNSALRTMGNVNGAYMEILERSRNSVTGILEHSSFPHFVAGLSAGVMECLVGHPLDTIRIGIMVSTGESLGPLAILKRLAQGFSSPQALMEIYRGVNSELLSAALGGALLFGVNELLKGTLSDIDAQRQKRLAESSEDPEAGIANGKIVQTGMWSSCTPELVVAAGFTGMLDGFTSKPLEMIKLRQQLKDSSSMAMSIGQTFRHIAQEGGCRAGAGSGLRNLFRGWAPTVLRESLGCMGFFAAYEVTKVNMGTWERERRAREVMRQQGIGNKQKAVQDADGVYEPSTGVILVAGAMAGLAYVLTSHPFEICCVLMQTDIPVLSKTLGGMVYRYTGMWQCLKSIVATGGWLALYRGAGTSIMRAIPSYAASWWGYELTLNVIEQIKQMRRGMAQSEEGALTGELVAA